MAKDLQRLRKIFNKTDGCCHICFKDLSFSNHGAYGSIGRWEIEHSIPKAKGGTDHLNNLFAACVDCNIDKGIKTSRTARSWHGNTRAPYGKKTKKLKKENNTAKGAIIGGLVGIIAGPWGAVIGATIGGIIGNESSPKK